MVNSRTGDTAEFMMDDLNRLRLVVTRKEDGKTKEWDITQPTVSMNKEKVKALQKEMLKVGFKKSTGYQEL